MSDRPYVGMNIRRILVDVPPLHRAEDNEIKFGEPFPKMTADLTWASASNGDVMPVSQHVTIGAVVLRTEEATKIAETA